MRAYINEQGVQAYENVIRRFYRKITFTSNDSFVVPQGSEQMVVDCVAAKGYGSGKGGRVQCILQVTPMDTLYITIGKARSSEIDTTYNATHIARMSNTYENRVVVAGGGGNNSSRGKAGGNGGGLTGAGGANGYGGSSGGKGGTQTAGGAGGAGTPVSVGHYHNGIAGSFGDGGAGISCGYEGNTGAGGAGWYGGGSGAGDWNKNGAYTAGGGGGSSYTDPNLCSEVVHTQGYQDGDGYVTMAYEVLETDEYDYYTETTEIKLIK